MVGRTYVVVSGPPASGKLALATQLAESLGLPLLAKDTVKDALMRRLAVPDIEASRELGRAAVAGLPGRVIEVLCRGDRDVAAARFAARAGTRWAGHFDRDRTPDELWNDEVAEPVSGGWEVIQVDTTEPVDVESVLAAVRRAMVGSPT